MGFGHELFEQVRGVVLISCDHSLGSVFILCFSNETDSQVLKRKLFYPRSKEIIRCYILPFFLNILLKYMPQSLVFLSQKMVHVYVHGT